MKIYTAVTTGVRSLKKEYIRELKKLCGEEGEIIADRADSRTLAARKIIAAETDLPVTVYMLRLSDKELTFDGADESVEWICGTVRDGTGLNYYEKRKKLAEDADAGLFLWDGEDLDIYMDILNLLMKGKCSVVIMSEDGGDPQARRGGICRIKSVDDLRKLLPEYWKNRRVSKDGFLSEHEYKKIIDAFIPSSEMADYLLANPVNKSQVIDIITNAPEDIEVKRHFCMKLSYTDDLYHELADEVEKVIKSGDHGNFDTSYPLYLNIRENTFIHHYKEINDAVNALKQTEENEFLYVENAEFKDMTYPDYAPFYNVKKWGRTPVLSKKQVERYMFWDECCVDRRAFGFEAFWYEAQKWCPGKTGDLEKKYIYTFTYDKPDKKNRPIYNERRAPSTVMFFEKPVYKGYAYDLYETDIRSDPTLYFPGKCMPPLPIPFLPGDVLEIDCLPFLPVTWVVLLEVNNGDPCGAQILFCNEDGLWEAGTLDRDFGVGYYRPKLSCFFRLKSYKFPSDNNKDKKQKRQVCRKRFPKRSKILKMVSDHIGHDQVKGSSLADEMYKVKKGGLTDDELADLVGGGEK